jgi:hypothetical protein
LFANDDGTAAKIRLNKTRILLRTGTPKAGRCAGTYTLSRR